MLQQKYKNSLIAIFYFLITFLLLIKFLFTAGIPHHGDFSFPVFTDNWFRELYPLWNESTSASNFQNVNRAIFLAPFILIFKFFSWKMEFLIKFLIFTLFFSSFFLAHLSIRFLIVKNLKRTINKHYLELSVFLGAVIFTLNPWVLDRVYAIFFWIAYIVTPPLLVLTYKLLRRITFYRIFIFTLLFSYASLTPHYLIFTFIIITAYIIIETIFARNKSFFILNAIRSFVMISILFFILNIYWLIPTIQVLSQSSIDPGYPITLEGVKVFSRNSNLLNVIRGTDAWVSWLDWYGSPQSPQGWKGVLWQIISLVGLLSYILFLRSNIIKKNVKIFLSLVFVMAIFMAQGFSNFIGGFYYWLIFNSPFHSLGWIFRDPNKFTGYVWLVYAFSVPIVLISIFQNKRKYFKLKILFFFLAFAFFILPKVEGYLYNYLLPVKLPSAYNRAYDFLRANQNPRYKTIFIAPYEQFSKSNLNYGISHTWNKSRIATNSIIRSSPVSSFGFYHFTNPFAQMYDYIYPNNDLDSVGLTLQTLGVEYLFYHGDVTNAQEQIKIDLATFNKDQNLELVFQDDFIYIYKVKNSLISKINFSQDYGVVSGGLNAKNIMDRKFPNLPLIFLDQDFKNIISNDNEMVEKGAKLKISYNQKYWNSDILRLSDKIIWPTEFYNKNQESNWEYVQTHNKYQTNRPWHSYVENFLKVHNEREFDFQKGIITTHQANAKYEIDLTDNLNEKKKVYVRLFKNRAGGKIEINFSDNQKKVVDTFSTADHFETIYLGEFNFNDCPQVILTNLSGHNAINYLAFLSSENNQKIPNDSNVFIADTNYPLSLDGKNNYLSNVFASVFVPRDKELSLALNDSPISFEGKDIKKEVVKMKKGENIIKKYKPLKNIDLVPGNIKYFNFHDKNVVDPIFTEDKNSTWKRLESEAVEINDENVFFFFNIHYEEMQQFHVRIDFLDADKKYLNHNILNKGRDGEGELIIREALIPPQGTHYFKVSYMSLDSEKESKLVVQRAYAELFKEVNPGQQIIALDKTLLYFQPDLTELKYQKENATHYNIESNAQGRGLVQFIESYDNLWRMKLKNGQILKPIQINSIFNGFVIRPDWNLEGATIYYLPQKYYKNLLIISFLAILIFGVYSIYEFYRWR